MKKLTILLSMFFIALTLFDVSFSVPNWYDDYGWRMNSTSGATTGERKYYVTINTTKLYQEGKISADCHDLKVVIANISETPYTFDDTYYYVSRNCPSDNTRIWFKKYWDGGTWKFQVYYGKTGAESGSNLDNLFGITNAYSKDWSGTDDDDYSSISSCTCVYAGNDASSIYPITYSIYKVTESGTNYIKIFKNRITGTYPLDNLIVKCFSTSGYSPIYAFAYKQGHVYWVGNNGGFISFFKDCTQIWDNDEYIVNTSFSYKYNYIIFIGKTWWKTPIESAVIGTDDDGTVQWYYPIASNKGDVDEGKINNVTYAFVVTVNSTKLKISVINEQSKVAVFSHTFNYPVSTNIHCTVNNVSKKLYVIESGDLFVFNISDPSNVTLINDFKITYAPTEMKADKENILYLIYDDYVKILVDKMNNIEFKGDISIDKMGFGVFTSLEEGTNIPADNDGETSTTEQEIKVFMPDICSCDKDLVSPDYRPHVYNDIYSLIGGVYSFAGALSNEEFIGDYNQSYIWIKAEDEDTLDKIKFDLIMTNTSRTTNYSNLDYFFTTVNCSEIPCGDVRFDVYASNYSYRRHVYSNINNETQLQFTAYLLNDVRGFDAKVYVTDGISYLKDITLKQMRYFYGEGTYKTVDTKTTENLYASMSFNPNAYYKFLIYEDGQLIKETTPERYSSEEIVLDISGAGGVKNLMQVIEQYSFSCGYNGSNGLLKCIGSSDDGSSHDWTLYVVKEQLLNKTIICDNTSSGQDIIMYCNLTGVNGTVYYTFKADGITLTTGSIVLSKEALFNFGKAGIVLTLVIVLAFGLMGIANPMYGVIGIAVGILICSFVGFINVPIGVQAIVIAIAVIVGIMAMRYG